MKHGRVSPCAKCPYYHKEDRQMIWCDGVNEDSVIHLAFARGDRCRLYKTEFCKTDFKHCKIYIMLEEINNGNDN